MKNYDPGKPSKCVEYLNKNNFFGWGMSPFLTYGEFKWLKNVGNFDMNSINKNSPIGYTLEVDLEYSDELHCLCNDYPLAPGKLAVPHDMLSDYY